MFGIFCRLTWLCYYDILHNFQKASGLEVNSSKSVIYHSDINQEALAWLSVLFSYEVQSISLGIKYLGSMLKTHCYFRSDWLWIPKQYFKKISSWEFRCLSLAGRVVLAQSVLNQLVVCTGLTSFTFFWVSSNLWTNSLPISFGVVRLGEGSIISLSSFLYLLQKALVVGVY